MTEPDLKKKGKIYVCPLCSWSGSFSEFNGRISENKADFPAAADVAVIIHPDIEKNKKNGGSPE